MAQDNITIAVCIISHEDAYYQTRYVIENLKEKTGCHLKFYLYSLKSEFGNKLKSYYKELISNCLIEDKNRKHFFENAYYGCDSVSECRWDFLSNFKDEFASKGINYCCFFPVTHLVNQNWAEDLVHACACYVNSGILSLRTGHENTRLSHSLFDDLSGDEILKPIWSADSNFVKGIQFFKADIADKLGACEFYEKHRITGYEDFEACFHTQAAGLKNFYIIGATAYFHPVNNVYLFGNRNEQNRSIFKGYIEEKIKEFYGQQHSDTDTDPGG